MTRILLLNIPAGPYASDFPPVAVTRVMDGVDPALGCEFDFLNLDYYRPDLEEVAVRVAEFAPDIIGISGMLTPSYAYLKRLSNFLGERFPEVVQVLGGQMTVIANIILLRTAVKFCVIGESEPAFSELIEKLQKDSFSGEDLSGYSDIKGLVFLKDGTPHFTGYSEENIAKGLKQFDYELAEKYTSLENYIHPVDGQYFRVRLINSDFEEFMRLLKPENLGKKLATVFASKGCVNTCTFCHRFFKGYKVVGNSDVYEYIEKLREDHDVGMVLFSEENFGNHRKSTDELVKYLKESGLNWAAPAVRVKSVNEEVIRSWAEAGCVHVNFGIESLSQKMLDVMEKRTTVDENVEAIRLCYKYGIFTVLGLVIGMPGETEETIEETIENLKRVVPDDVSFPFELYINFVQAIPGTPVYEYAKGMRLIGKTLDEEEDYIEGLIDTDANEIKHYLNFTDYEKEELAYWKYYISMEIICEYIKKNGYFTVMRHKKTRPYRLGLAYALIPKPVRKFLLKHAMMARFFGFKGVAGVVVKKITKFIKGEHGRFSSVNRSLRKINSETPTQVRDDELGVAVLRKNR